LIEKKLIMMSMEHNRLQLWLLAIRPKTLPAAVSPIAVGTSVAFAAGKFALFPALGCLAGALLLQIAVNLANDYFDYKNDIDSEERLGPVRMTQSGLISPSSVRNGMIVALFLATLVFAYLSFVGGLPIVIIGLFSVLAALAYSGGPYPLASHGLGELFVFIFFGPVAVGGTYFVQAGQFSWLAMVAAVPPGFLITAIMVVNNLRDIETDGKAGKKSLAVMLGRKNTILEYRVLVGLSYCIPPVIYFGTDFGMAVLLPLATLPLAWLLGKRVGRLEGSSFNALLASTAGLSLVYSLLFSVGLVTGN
jgi:1,4-dihydroxy-2-naphthoate octaprenyltransferase